MGLISVFHRIMMGQVNLLCVISGCPGISVKFTVGTEFLLRMYRPDVVAHIFIITSFWKLAQKDGQGQPGLYCRPLSRKERKKHHEKFLKFK